MDFKDFYKLNSNIELTRFKHNRIVNFTEAHKIKIGTYVIVSKKDFLKAIQSDNHFIVQDGKIVRPEQVKPDTFFFGIHRGCGQECILILPK